MKEITEEQIKQASLGQNQTVGHIFNSEYQSYIKGAKWMQKEMQPEWIPCTHKKVLPKGRYALYVYNSQTKCGTELLIYHDSEREIGYFFATHYYPISLPDPPKI